MPLGGQRQMSRRKGTGLNPDDATPCGESAGVENGVSEFIPRNKMDEKSPDGASAQELYRAGRRFRVIQPGARLVHGNFGENGGAVDLPIGSILKVRGWMSDFDADIHLIWASVDGRPVEGIIGNDPHTVPWAVFAPAVAVTYSRGPDLSEQVTAPDGSYLQPLDDLGDGGRD